MLRTFLAALLSLAFVLIWAPFIAGSASSYHAAQAGMLGHHADTEQADQHGRRTIKTEAECDASAVRCCMMAHCCPGMSVGPQDMPGFVSDDVSTAALAVCGTGCDPGLVLPPPRSLDT
jgi:hypothetical protein